MNHRADVAVVGGGILGLAHALVLARRGRSVVVFERGPRATGASIRNFGMIWPIGQPAGEMHQIALRSRELWLDALVAARLPYLPTGSLHVAHHDDEADVLREFAELGPAAGFECQWIEPQEAVERSRAVRAENLKGALWSDNEITVDPRRVIAGLPAYLQSIGVDVRFGEAVRGIELPVIETASAQWHVDSAVVCSGDDFATLYPDVFATSGLTRLASGEWRQRFESGEYYVRANGIAQQNPDVFAQPPYGAGNLTWRGSLESKGQLAITDQWKFGWQFTLLSDKFFLNDYNIPSQTLSYNYISETTSTVYLTGQGDRSYFDLRGFYFEGLSTHDFQPQQPTAHPVLDYNKTFDIDPAKSNGIGGQVQLDFNLTSVSASAASFQSVGTQVLDSAFGLYNVCTNYVPGTVTGTCLLRGIGGDFTRATLDLSWKRKLIDPIGEVWTPFAFARVNGEWLDLNTSNTYTFTSAGGSSTFTNASQLNFVDNKADALYGAVVPGVGLDYRYPFFANIGFGSITVEPIGQIVVRPSNQLGSNSLVNLDAQSLVFDESTLFEWDKYSGYDRFETGIRANYGGQFTLNFKDGAYVNVVGGQSYQVAGTNSYATPDAANVGLSSGLDTRLSDYVGAFTIAPIPIFSFTAKGRFDVDTLEARRIDLVGTYNLGAWTGGIQYANYQSQPVIGYYVRREGLSLNSRYNISENYYAQGNITFDMSRQFYPPAQIGYTHPGAFAIAAFGLGAGYTDDCTTFSVSYSSVYYDSGNTALTRNQTWLVQLVLRTLGAAKYSQTTTNTTALDGVKY